VLLGLLLVLRLPRRLCLGVRQLLHAGQVRLLARLLLTQQLRLP
jgi:hypothetical protein